MNKKNKNILIAPVEIGGQMQLLAETLRKRGFNATAAAMNDDWRQFTNDINMVKPNFWKRIFFTSWAILNYDVFHFFWGRSLFSFWRFHNIDLPVLRLLNKKVIVHFRGLDIVDIKYFDYRRQLFYDPKVKAPPLSRKNQLKALRKWRKYADTLLVSEPDLFAAIPEATLSPQAIDCDYWSSSKVSKSEEDGVIKIVHAPTSRRKKGTEFIESAVENLKDKGYAIELLLAEKMPAHAIKEIYEKADIGVDQLLYGWHGKVSVELMSMGKPVLCYIDEDLKKYRPDLPIINANPNTIEAELERLINNAEQREAISKLSIEYARKYHDVEKIADELLELYGIKEKSIRDNKQLEGVKTW